MATVFKCDGCDGEFKDKRGNLTEITIGRESGDGDRYNAANKSTDLDLCRVCQTQFERFLKDLVENRVEAG